MIFNKKYFPFIIVCIFTFTTVKSQQLGLKFTSSTGSESEVINNQTISLGYFHNTSSLESTKLTIKNNDPTNDLNINNISAGNSQISVFIPFNPTTSQSYKAKTLSPGEEFSFQIYYGLNSQKIYKHENYISFTTNDISNPNVKVNFVVNPETGVLKMTPEKPYNLINRTINLGNVKINHSKSFQIEMRNVGKGYMNVLPFENIITNNKLSTSTTKVYQIGEGGSFNTNLRFEGVTPGEINSSFDVKLEHGNFDKQTYQIIGKVIAPRIQFSYNSNIISDGIEVTLPDNGKVLADYFIAVKNTGDDILTVTRINIENDTESEFTINNDMSSVTINPGQTYKYKLHYHPKKVGQKNIKVTFNSDAYSQNRFSANFKLKVSEMAPVIRLSDRDNKQYGYSDIFKMGLANNEQTVEKDIVITNGGDKKLIISNIVKSEDTYSNFEIINSPKMSLSPGEKTFLSLRFTPKKFRSTRYLVHLNFKSNSKYANDFIFKVEINHNFSDIYATIGLRNFNSGSTFDMGIQSVNAERRIKFALKNESKNPMSIENIRILDDSDKELKIFMKPEAPIAFGNTDTIGFIYNPTKTGKKTSAKLCFETSDYCNKIFVLNLKGRPIKPTVRLWRYGKFKIVENNSTIDYSTINSYTVRELDFTIVNRTEDKLNVSDFKIESPDAITVVVDKVINHSLSYGQELKYILKFSCIKPGEHITKLSFKTNDYENPVFTYYIKLKGTMPVIELYSGKTKLESNDKLEFKKGTTAKLLIKNTGNNTLNITNVHFTGSDADSFEVKGIKRQIVEGGSNEIELEHTGISKSKESATLQFTTDDATIPLFKLQLACENKITSIDESLAKSIKVYPNAFADHINVEHNLQGNTTLNIFNSYGILLYKSQSLKRDSRHDLQILPSGIYFLQIINSNKSYTKRIIKK